VDEDSEIDGVMKFDLPVRPSPSRMSSRTPSCEKLSATTSEDSSTSDELKDAQRPVLLSLIDDAFFHGVNIRVAKHAAEMLLPDAAAFLHSDHAIQGTMDRLVAIGLEVPWETAHVIASALAFYTALQDGKRHLWMVGGILGRLSRSYMVEDRKGILGNWRWITPPRREAQPDGTTQFVCGDATTTPMVSSLVRDRLVDPVDIRSIVEGIAMLPGDVMRFFHFSDAQK
jgi:hypothetical protein